jgi:hypothetical protein
MGESHRCRIDAYRGLDDFAGIDRGFADGSARQRFGVQNTMLLIEPERFELLMFEGTNPCLEIGDRIFWPA